LSFAPEALAQGAISGLVLDDQQQPLVQANVFIPDLERGTASDLNGEYTLEGIPAGVYEVRASFVGFEPQTIAVTVIDGQTTAQNFELEPQQLETAIVEGYRVRRAPVETGATAVVDARDIETLTVRSADGALQGRAAGVRVTSLSGQPGAGLQVQVRGSGSITAGNSPLYIVDGVQISNDNELNLASGNPLATINPSEIESIQVLKDAAATSIYGAQAANGVVLVTTKRGRAGRTEFTLDTQVGAVDKLGDYQVLNSEQFLQNRYEALLNFFVLNRGLSREDAAEPAASNAIRLYGGEVNDAGEYVPSSEVSTDWQDEVFQTGLTQQYSLGARGGNERTRFFLQGRFADDEGQVIASKFRQYGLRLNLDHNATDWLQFETSLNTSNSNYRGTIGDGAFINSPYWAAQFIPPTQSVYNEPGNPESGLNLTPDPTFRYNPVAQETFDTRNADVFRLIGGQAANVSLPYGLLARSYAGLNFGDVQEQDYRDPRIPANQGLGEGSVNGRLSVLASRTLEFNISQSLQWNYDVTDASTFDALGVVEYRRGFEDDVNTRGVGFPNDLFRTLASAAEPEIANSFKTEYRFISFVGQGEYTFDNTYQLSGTLRYDGSSRFGTENRFGLFGAISAYARLSNLGPLRNIDLIDDLKLRASYGTTGNSDIGNFAALQLFGGAGEYAGLPGIRPTSLGNTILTWEELREVNVGLDYAFAGGFLSGSVDVYNRDSAELLLERDLPGDSGFNIVTENVGTVRQQGLEFALNTQNVRTDLFRWSTTFNIAFQNAEVIELVGDDEEIVLDNGLVYRVGEAPAQYRYTEYAGVNPATGRPFYYDENGELTYDPNLAPENQPLWGNGNADYFGGLGNTFGIGPVSLDVFFQYDFGRTTLNNNAFFSDAGFAFNKSERVLDRWQQPGDITAMPAPIFNDAYNDGTSSRAFTTRFLEDASYIRLKQLTLSFQVPQRYLGAVANRARFYVQGENLLTFTEFTDLDPELVGNALGEFPQSRRVIAGLNLSF
jgi:TonB-linked SusC/RagA family outer membrane protein